MSEGMLLVVWVVKVLIVLACAVLYRVGGWVWKPARRYIMPTVYIGSCVGLTFWVGKVFNPWMLVSLPILVYALTMGYSNNEGQGWKRRLIITALLILAFLPFAIIFDSWGYYIWHAVLCSMGMAYLGIISPSPYAVDEEANIALVTLIAPIMMI